MQGAELTACVEQAIIVGAQAIASAGATQDTFNLEQLVQDVGVRTTASTTEAVEVTATMVAEAALKLHATEATKKAIAEAGETARKSFGESITSAQRDLRSQVTQLLARLKPVLDEFGARLSRRADEQSGALLEKATRALDADDPTSPMAKHLKQLDHRNAELAKKWDARTRSSPPRSPS